MHLGSFALLCTISSSHQSPRGLKQASSRQQDRLLMAHHRNYLFTCWPDLSATGILQFCQLFLESPGTCPLCQTLQSFLPGRHFTTCIFFPPFFFLGIPWSFALVSRKQMSKWWKNTSVFGPAWPPRELPEQFKWKGSSYWSLRKHQKWKVSSAFKHWRGCYLSDILPLHLLVIHKTSWKWKFAIKIWYEGKENCFWNGEC